MIQKKFLSLLGCTAVLSCAAVELPERILSGYTGHFFGQELENGHVFRMIDRLGEQKFNSIEVKFHQKRPASVRCMQLDKYKNDVAKIYERAKSKGLMLQVYLYPSSKKRNKKWPEHAACAPVVTDDGQAYEDSFAINSIQAWRAMFEHAYSFARLHNEIPFASLKFDIETTHLLYSYDDGTWQRFCAANPRFPANTPAAERAGLLKTEKAETLYEKFFDNEVEAAVKTFAAELHAISPDLILGFMPARPGTLSQIMERCLATSKVPAIVDGWNLYNGSGWVPDILNTVQRVKKNHPNNRYVAWLRPDNYDEEDISIHAYHTAAHLDGYSIWVLSMLDEKGKRVPQGITAAGHLRAFGKANEAVLADIKQKTLTSPQRIAYKKAKGKVASLKYQDLVIPTLKPVGSGALAGSVKRYLLREQQVVLFYAKSGETINISLAHLGGRKKPTALQYAILDQQKKVLRNESLTYGTRSDFSVTAPHTGTFAMVLSAGLGGQAWYSVETKHPYAAVYQYGKSIYFFRRQKLFLAGGALGNPQFRFETTPTESWRVTVDGGPATVLKRQRRTDMPLPDKNAVEVNFSQYGKEYCQNIFLSFPDGKNPLVFFGPERTVEIVK